MERNQCAAGCRIVRVRVFYRPHIRVPLRDTEPASREPNVDLQPRHLLTCADDPTRSVYVRRSESTDHYGGTEDSIPTFSCAERAYLPRCGRVARSRLEGRAQYQRCRPNLDRHV